MYITSQSLVYLVVLLEECSFSFSEGRGYFIAIRGSTARSVNYRDCNCYCDAMLHAGCAVRLPHAVEFPRDLRRTTNNKNNNVGYKIYLCCGHRKITRTADETDQTTSSATEFVEKNTHVRSITTRVFVWCETRTVALSAFYVLRRGFVNFFAGLLSSLALPRQSSSQSRL